MNQCYEVSYFEGGNISITVQDTNMMDYSSPSALKFQVLERQFTHNEF